MNCFQQFCQKTGRSFNYDPTLQEDDDSNEFYFPNMCHVCQIFGENANIKRCGACGMISYCCEEHQIKDWQSHKQFCKAICQMKKSWKVDSVFDSLKSNVRKVLHTVNYDKEYFMFLVTLLMPVHYAISNTAVQLLQRKLTKTEYEMILFPRICAVCCETNSKLLTNCKACPQSSFCKEHLNDPNHENECMKIVSCFNTLKSQWSRNIRLFPEDDLMKINSHYYPEDKKLPSSMLQFIESRSSTDLIHFGSCCIKETIFQRLLSHRFSRALTILFSIEKLNFNLQSMVIHVVGSTEADLFDNDWEVIFHFLPRLSKLELIFIGPEISELGSVHQVCDVCKKEDRKMLIKRKKTLYHEYCREESFLKPDMIVCFNSGFQIYDTWKESIEVFDKGQCPLLFTSLNKVEGLFEKSFIDATFPSAKCVYFDENPFTYIYYNRQCIHLPITADNQFLSIYEFLGKKKSRK